MPDTYSQANFAVQNLANQTTPRTWQARLSERVNVKDFGAVGDGSHDDTTNIQNAVNAAIAAGGGTIYFPTTSSYYKVTAAITFPAHGVSPAPATGRVLLRFLGERGNNVETGHGSVIQGNVTTGFILDNNDTQILTVTGVTGSFAAGDTISDNPLSQGTTTPLYTAVNNAGTWTLTCAAGGVEFTGLPLAIKNQGAATGTLTAQVYPIWYISQIDRLAIVNQSTTALSTAINGAVRIEGSQVVTVERCFLKGMIGLYSGDSSYAAVARDCFFQGPGGAGTIGQYCGINNFNCNFIGWDTCILRGGTTGGAIIGCRFENSFAAITLGQNLFVGTGLRQNAAVSGLLIASNQTEQCNTDVTLFNCNGIVVIGNYFSGTVGCAQANRDYGIRMKNTCNAVSVIGNQCAGNVNNALMNFGAEMFPNCVNITVIGNVATNSGVGANWDVTGFVDTSTATGSRLNNFFLAGNNTPTLACTVAQLPNTPVKGDRMVVTDATSVVFQAALAGTGANVVPVYYDGAGWRVG